MKRPGFPALTRAIAQLRWQRWRERALEEAIGIATQLSERPDDPAAMLAAAHMLDKIAGAQLNFGWSLIRFGLRNRYIALRFALIAGWRESWLRRR